MLVELVNIVRLKVVDGQGFGSPATGIESVYFAGFGFLDDGEEVSSHAVDVRHGDTDYGVCGDGRVDCVATGFEDFRAGLRREELRRRDDAAVRDDHRAAL